MVEKIFLWGLGLYIPIIDLVDMSLRMFARSKLTPKGERMCATSVPKVSPLPATENTPLSLRPYKVLVSVHNIFGHFEEFKKNLGVFGYNNVLVVDDASTDATRRLLAEEGIPHITNKENLNKPASIYQALKILPRDVDTVAVMDPDASMLNLNPKEYNKKRSDFDEVMYGFQNSGHEACAVRILVRCESLLEYLQNFEYKISMGLARKSMGDFCAVSGAFALYNRNYLQKVLKEHSVSIYGEDYETSLRILGSGGRIYYDGRLSFLTRQRKTLWDLTKQRMGWDFALAKIHYLVRDKLGALPKSFFSFYQYMVYNTFILILFHPVRILSCLLLLYSFANMLDKVTTLDMIKDNVFNNPLYFVGFYVFYTITSYIFLFAVERRRRDRYALILLAFPFYSLYINLVPRTLGFLNFISIMFFKKKLVEDGYKYTDNGNGNGNGHKNGRY